MLKANERKRGSIKWKIKKKGRGGEKRNLGISPISGQKQGELQWMQRETYETTVIEIKRAIFLGKRFFQRALFSPPFYRNYEETSSRTNRAGFSSGSFEARCAEKFWISRVFNFHRDSP